MKKERKKIVIIGPVYPYKGGISHYTALTYGALRKKHSVKVLSYKLQYPKILYKKEQKDYSNDVFKIDDAHYLINTMNPFNCIRIARKVKKSLADMVVFQWWHPYFAPCYWIMEKIIGKQIKKVFVCHNVFPHERFPMDRWLAKIVLKNGDAFITHSSLDTQDLLSIKPDAECRQTVHPTYNAFKLDNLTKDEARKILGIETEKKVLLFFGFVRKYKGLKYLLDAMPMIDGELENVELLIVGDFDGDKEEYLQQINNRHIQKITKIYDGYIPDKEVEKFFAASDLVVLPYESATQSGIVQIAYGFEKPVVVTNVGGLPDVVEDGETGYVVEPCNPKKFSEAVCAFFNNEKIDFGANIRREAYKYSWERMVEIIESFDDSRA